MTAAWCETLAGERSIALESSSSEARLTLVGEFDLTASEHLTNCLHRAVDQARMTLVPCVVDMSGVAFIQCETLHRIARVAASSGATVRVARPSPVACLVLLASGYDRELTVDW